MKKVLFALVLIVIIAVVFLSRCSGGFGLGLGLGTGKGDGENAVVKEEQEAETEAEEIVKSLHDENENNETIIKVSVAGSDYFYENEKIELDRLLQEIAKIEGNFVVEIKDEQASKKAYEALTKALKDNGISYTEK